MSRTFRRKNYETTQNTSWDTQGRKIAGYFTEYDFVGGETFWWNRGNVVYREPTREEYNKEHRRIHRDAHRNAWSPSREYRSARHAENRSLNTRELIKWTKDPDNYEPLCEANPRSCLWDWR